MGLSGCLGFQNKIILVNKDYYVVVIQNSHLFLLSSTFLHGYLVWYPRLLSSLCKTFDDTGFVFVSFFLSQSVDNIQARGFLVLFIFTDVFALGERLFSRPMSMNSDARDVSSAGYGSKLLIG